MSSSEEYTIAERAASSGRGKSLRIRIGESLFRRWPLYLLPIVALGAYGAVVAKDTTRQYQSIGTVNVASSTFLANLTDVNTPNFGYDTPATKTARDIVQHLSSAEFTRTVAANAGLTSAVAAGTITLDKIRASVSASASGDNVLAVIATTDDAVLSQRLATSVMTSYTAYVLGVETAQYSVAVKYYQGNLVADAQAVTAANAALDAYLTKNPAPAVGTRSDVQTVQIARLNAVVSTAQARIDGDQAQLDKSQLAIKQSESDIGQRLQVVDKPTVPTSPRPIMLKRALTLVTFLILGLLVSIAALVAAALLDHSVRSVGDVVAIEGLQVIGMIPKQPTKRRSTQRIVPELVTATAPK